MLNKRQVHVELLHVCGVFNGIFYNAATTLKPTWSNWYNQPITPANSENLTAFVLDNPHQLYVGSVSAIMSEWTS